MSTRRALEWALRTIALALSVWLVVLLARGSNASNARVVRASELDAALPSLTSDRASSLHVDVDRQMSGRDLQWVVALRDAGTTVTWSGDVPAIALASAAIADPIATSRVAWEASNGGRSVLVAEGDSLSLGTAATGVVTRAGRGGLAVEANGWTARAMPNESASLGNVIVAGSAEWETRFVIDALEERGWKVDARIPVAPSVAVQQGSAQLDTAHTAVAIVLDSAAASSSAGVRAFVASGGGLIIVGNAPRALSLGTVAPARVGAHVASRPHLVTDTVNLASVGHYLLTLRDSNAVVLTRGSDGPLVVAQRRGVGRVVQVAPDETWRWRMSGDEGSVLEHRAWWATIVAAAAYATLPNDTTRDVAPWSSAPRAALVAALGPPMASAPAAHALAFAPHSALLLVIVLILLLAEWTSRRLRGAA